MQVSFSAFFLIFAVAIILVNPVMVVWAPHPNISPSNPLLAVNAFSNAKDTWSTHGNSPYLGDADSSNYIYLAVSSGTSTKVSWWWTFNTTTYTTITGAELWSYGEVTGSGTEVGYVYFYNGSGKQVASDNWGWGSTWAWDDDGSILPSCNTQTKANNIKLNITISRTSGSGSNTVYLSAVFIALTGTGAATHTIASAGQGTAQSVSTLQSYWHTTQLSSAGLGTGINHVALSLSSVALQLASAGQGIGQALTLLTHYPISGITWIISSAGQAVGQGMNALIGKWVGFVLSNSGNGIGQGLGTLSLAFLTFILSSNGQAAAQGYSLAKWTLHSVGVVWVLSGFGQGVGHGVVGLRSTAIIHVVQTHYVEVGTALALCFLPLFLVFLYVRRKNNKPNHSKR